MINMKLRSTYIQPESSPVASQIKALAYWETKRAGRIAPLWSEISLLDFGAASVPNINVVDIDPATRTMKYRFWGTGLTEIFGKDFTGDDPNELPSGDFKNGAISGLDRLIEEKRPNCEVREFFRPTGVMGSLIVLRLPLSDDGQSITHALSVCNHEITNPHKSISTFFEEVFGAGA